MKLEDIKIGMKVVPHDKSAGNTGLYNCSQWNIANQTSQRFLYVVQVTGVLIELNYKKSAPSGSTYRAKDIEPYQEPTMTITQEQFDNLKEGDVVNNKYNGDIFFQGKIGKVSFWVNSSGYSNTLSLADLQNLEYSLVTKPENYKGFPLGDYDDKVVIVEASNSENYGMITVGIITTVTKNSIYITGYSNPFKYARIINPTPFQLV